jgi:branched-chain amino acid transport system ATP-binding protein
MSRTQTSDGAAVGASRTAGDVLVVTDLEVRFAGVVALAGVSLTVHAGQVHSVLGPNGAGKSTLFNLISGFYTPTGGDVVYGGQSLLGLRPHQIARRGVSRTFQNLELSVAESVLDNIQLGCHQIESAGVLRACVGWPGAVRSERRSRDRAHEMAELVGLSGVLHEACGQLAYGVQKRVEIARALASSPGLLLLDEPVAGMTAQEVGAMQTVIHDIHDATGVTILLIEHDVEFALSLADEVTVVDFGKVIAHGSPAQIRAHPAVIEAYLGVGLGEVPPSTDGEIPCNS